MDKKSGPVAWARKVRQDRIRQLYKQDALGIVDEELIDEVGYAMYARCESILTATEAGQGRVACPQCLTVIRRGRSEAIRCSCGWQTTWTAYRTSYRGKQLHALGALPAIERFAGRWPQTRSARDKLLLIDSFTPYTRTPRISHTLGPRPST